jgi:hypothetical protein
MFCSNCGQSLPDGSRFCGYCGHAVAAAAPAGGPAPTPAPASAAPASVPPLSQGASVASGAGAGQASSGSGFAGLRQAVDARAPGLIARVRNILLQPAKEWQVIDAEPSTAAEIYTGYVAILAAIGPIAALIGVSLVGVDVPFVGRLRTPILTGVATMVLSYLMVFVSVFVVSWLVDALAPTFGGQKDSLRALKVTAYSFTAAWVAAVLNLIPSLGILAFIASLYCLYLLYLGLPVLMRCPPDKALGYTVVTVLCGIVISLVLSFVTGGLLWALGFHGGAALGGMSGSATKAERTADTAAAASVISKMFGGKSAEDQQRVASALQQLEKMGEQVSKPAPPGTSQPDAGQALGAVGQVLTGGQQVQVVDFRQLKALLPESLPGGMQRSSLSGESGEVMGIKSSHATASYRNASGATLRIEIADLGSMSGLAGLALKFNPNVTKESDTGYERTTTVDGQMVHERFDRSSNTATVNVIVANRFNVEAQGSGVDMDTVKSSLRQIDMARLASAVAAR